MANLTLKEIHVYPIKSGAGLSLDSAEVVERGFAWDRRWMVIRDNGDFITQRKKPEMARMKTRIDSSWLYLRLGEQEFQLPLEPAFGVADREATVWGDSCKTWQIDREVDRALSDFLGESCSLVYMPDFVRRPIDGGSEEGVVSFADGFPFLITTMASLEDFNTRLATPIPMARFRPNLVIEGGEAWAEDHWSRIRIGDVEFTLPKACSRCVIINNCQEAGVSSPEPLKSLGEFRKKDEAGAKGVIFGENAVHGGHGRLAVGMPVDIL